MRMGMRISNEHETVGSILGCMNSEDGEGMILVNTNTVIFFPRQRCASRWRSDQQSNDNRSLDDLSIDRSLELTWTHRQKEVSPRWLDCRVCLQRVEDGCNRKVHQSWVEVLPSKCLWLSWHSYRRSWHRLSQSVAHTSVDVWPEWRRDVCVWYKENNHRRSPWSTDHCDKCERDRHRLSWRS